MLLLLLTLLLARMGSASAIPSLITQPMTFVGDFVINAPGGVTITDSGSLAITGTLALAHPAALRLINPGTARVPISVSGGTTIAAGLSVQFTRLSFSGIHTMEVVSAVGGLVGGFTSVVASTTHPCAHIFSRVTVSPVSINLTVETDDGTCRPTPRPTTAAPTATPTTTTTEAAPPPPTMTVAPTGANRTMLPVNGSSAPTAMGEKDDGRAAVLTFAIAVTCLLLGSVVYICLHARCEHAQY